MNKKIVVSVIVAVVFAIFSFIYFFQTIIIFNGTQEYKDLIDKYSERFEIDPMFVRAVMKRESNVRATAISNKGAVGLMQIMPKTGEEIAKSLKVQNYNQDMLKEPETNIMFGTYYLKKLLDRYDNDAILALGAYNAGLGNIDILVFKNAGEVIMIKDMPFYETNRHVRAVMLTYQFYKGEEKLRNMKKLMKI
jgi:soluble lytic murein transglycosylase